MLFIVPINSVKLNFWCCFTPFPLIVQAPGGGTPGQSMPFLNTSGTVYILVAIKYQSFVLAADQEFVRYSLAGGTVPGEVRQGLAA